MGREDSGVRRGPPGTDLAQHARALRAGARRRARRRTPPAAPAAAGRAVVDARAAAWGSTPSGPTPATRSGGPRSSAGAASSPLSLVIDECAPSLGSVADASRFIMVVTDADGVILWREGSAARAAAGRRARLQRGRDAGPRTTVGTNAIGTALAEAAPVQLFSAEHFEEGQIPWYCTAAPLHDPRTGELLGIVDVSGPALTLHPAIGALVETAVRLAEAQLWRHHEQRLERLRQVGRHVLATASGPLLLVDDHGWVAHHAGIAAGPDRGAGRATGRSPSPGSGCACPSGCRRGLAGAPVRPATPGGRSRCT